MVSCQRDQSKIILSTEKKLSNFDFAADQISFAKRPYNDEMMRIIWFLFLAKEKTSTKLNFVHSNVWLNMWRDKYMMGIVC